MLFSVLTRNGEVPRLNFSPVRSRSWLKSSQLMVPSEPGPQTLPSCHPWGSQVPGTSHLQLLRPPKWWGPGPADDILGKWLLPLGHRGGDRGEVHCSLKAWVQPASGFGESPRALQDTAPSLFSGSLHSLTGLKPGKLEGHGGEGQDPPLTLFSAWRPTTPLKVGWMASLRLLLNSWSLVGGAHCGTDQWLSRIINGHSLTAAWGRGPLRGQPMAGQDH